MCLGVPVQVIQMGNGTAVCRGANGDEQINMLMVGDQAVGTWVLNYLGWARVILSEQEACEINKALDAINALMNGAKNLDIDHYFPEKEDTSC